MAGFANLKSPTQLDCFYVHPDFQRQGVGSALFKAVSEQAQKAKAAFLESDISLTAEPFFRAQGWMALHRNKIQREDQILINTTMRFTFPRMENTAVF
ncbi:MAG: GNAT family N-acetyltransferase [Holdemania massiliensis]